MTNFYKPQLLRKVEYAKYIAVLLISLACHIGYAQNTVQTVGDKQYVFSNGKWQYYHPASQTLWDIGKRIYVKYKSTASSTGISNLEQQFGITKQKVTYGVSIYTIPSSGSIFSICDSLITSSIVDSAEIAISGKLHSTPNDPLASTYQWYLSKIDAYGAWNTNTGSNNVVVAVIDNGIHYPHPDLGNGTGTNNYENIWKNGPENDWSNPMDPATGNATDNNSPTNGFVDDYKGINTFQQIFVNNTTVIPFTNNNYSLPYYTMASPIDIPLMNHGTIIAGIIGAKTNNGIGMSGIAGGWGNTGCQIMSINTCDQTDPGILDPSDAADAITYAVDNGAKIISLSYGFPTNYSVQANAINYANTHGVVVMCSSGNSNGTITFPAAYSSVISVGGTDQTDSKASFANYGPGLTIAAPATNIYSTTFTNGYSYNNPSFPSTGVGGTSFASPMVSATAALMISENSCLSKDQVKDLLINTADKVGGYDYYWSPAKFGHSKELGYGRLNTRHAVEAATQMRKTSEDLYIKDWPSDFGGEPSSTSLGKAWESQDIWIRNQADGFTNQYHEDPVYTTGQPLYVYVRVRNKSCTNSTTGTLQLYWAKAATGLSWPAPWNGSGGTPTMGGSVGTKSISSSTSSFVPIPAGGEQIFQFVWYMPNPAIYAVLNDDLFHFCLLARISSTADPMTFTETSNLYNNVVNNNNIAQKNIYVLDPNYPHKFYGGVVHIGSAHEGATAYNFGLEIPTGRSNIFTDAEVTMKMDDATWTKWTSIGRLGSNVEVKSEEEHIIKMLNENATVEGLSYDAGEGSFIAMRFNYLADSAENGDKTYALHLIQTKADDHSIVGGELYLLNKLNRASFEADAGPDQIVNKNDIVTISAQTIGEIASYNWYDTSGHLVDTGSSFTVSPDVSERFQLQVISTDGFVSYDDMEVKVRKGTITTVYPNPATTSLTLDYTMENVTSAYLIVVQPFSSTVSNYIISPTANTTNINTSSFASGVYNILMVCDGQITDATTFQKQ